MTAVRIGTIDDIDRIVEMSINFLLLTPFGRLLGGEPKPELLAQMIAITLANGVIMVAETDVATVIDGDTFLEQRVIGMLALYVATHPLTGLPMGDEIAWWVEPEHRNGRAGWLLYRATERWAREHGLSMIKMVAPADDPSVGAFYVRLNYTPAETVYLKSLLPQPIGGIL